MSTLPQAPTRAPALYVSGLVEREQDGDVRPCTFRLPCPPSWDDRRPGAWAAERRARRAYFATLDALRTGTIDPDEEAKIERLLNDLRSNAAQETIRHFQRILGYVRAVAAGGATLPDLPAPMKSVVITAPVPTGPSRSTDLTTRYRWTLDWLEARRYVVAGKALRLEWKLGTRGQPLGATA